jgi:hypothetical protein
MAGNDGDLLKQATQAMMSRYEGKILGCCSFTEGLRHVEVHTSGDFGAAIIPAGRRARSFAQIPFAPPVPVFSSASGCCCHDDVSRTCLNVKVDEGVCLINAAIGRSWAHPERAEHRTRRLAAIWSPNERIF